MDWVWIAALSWLGLSSPVALLIGYYLRRRGDEDAAPPETARDLREPSAPPPPTPATPPTEPKARRTRALSPALARSVHPPGSAPLRGKSPGTAPEEPGRPRTSGGGDAEPGTPSPAAGARRRSRLHRRQ